jgi:hypothetical protein
MNKKTIIIIAISTIVLILIFSFLNTKKEKEETLPTHDSSDLEGLVIPEKFVNSDLPIAQLTEQEKLELGEKIQEAITEESTTEEIQKLDKKLALLSVERLREITVGEIKELLINKNN